jgi:hypothetical protein
MPVKFVPSITLEDITALKEHLVTTVELMRSATNDHSPNKEEANQIRNGWQE